MMTKLLKSITSARREAGESRAEKPGPPSSAGSVVQEQHVSEKVFEEVIASGKDPPIDTLEELHHHAFRLLSNTADPHRLERTKLMLERYRGEDWRLWKQRFSSSAEADTYGRSAVWGHTGCFQLLTLTWAPGCSSPIHNHPCERCFLLPLQGQIVERRYYVCEETKEVKEFLYTRLEHRRAYWMDDSIGWHAVFNEGDECAVSLHLYIPEIRKCKIVNPRTNDITWCICPSSTRDSLPAASVRLLEIVAAAVRKSVHSGRSMDRLLSSSTRSSVTDSELRVSSSVDSTREKQGRRLMTWSAFEQSDEAAGSTEQQHLPECRTETFVWKAQQQRLLTLLLRGLQRDAEAELQQVLAGGEPATASNVSLFTRLLRPFSYYYSCAAVLPPAACAAVVLHDLMFKRNSPPLADGAALQQISLALLLALMLFNKENSNAFIPTFRSSSVDGSVPNPLSVRNASVNSGRFSDVEGLSSVASLQHGLLSEAPQATKDLPSYSTSSQRCDVVENSLLLAQLQEAAMRALKAYSSSKSNRVWDGWQEATELACVGRLVGAQLLLCESEYSYATSAVSTAKAVPCVSGARCLHCSPTTDYTVCRCCSSGYCRCCMAADFTASPVVLVFRFIDQAMLYHLASILGWDRSLEDSIVTSAVALGPRRALSQEAAATAAEAVSRLKGAGRQQAALETHEREGGARTDMADRVLLSHSFSFDGSRAAVTTAPSAHSNISRAPHSTCSSTRRVKAPSVFYHSNSTRSDRSKAYLLSLLRATKVAGHGGAAVGVDPALQDAAANMVRDLLEDVKSLSPLRDVVSCFLLRLDSDVKTGGVRALLSHLTRTDTSLGTYEKQQQLLHGERAALKVLEAGSGLQRQSQSRTMGNLELHLGKDASEKRLSDVGRVRPSSDWLHSKVTASDGIQTISPVERRGGSLLAGWFGTVKKRLGPGVLGVSDNQGAVLHSHSGDNISSVTRIGRHGYHRPVVGALPPDSRMVNNEEEQQQATAGKNDEGVATLLEEKEHEALKQQQKQPTPERLFWGDSGDPATRQRAEVKTAENEKSDDKRCLPGCCEGAASARSIERDAFAACWLLANEEHLAIFKVVVAALNEFFTRDFQQSQSFRAPDCRQEDSSDLPRASRASSNQLQRQQQQQAEGSKVCSTLPGSSHDSVKRAEGGFEGCPPKRSGRRVTLGEGRGGDVDVHEGEEAATHRERIGEFDDAANDDFLCVYHYVAKHLTTTQYTFSLYCSEGDVAQLQAVQRAVQLLTGNGYPCNITRKVRVETVRATSIGLLDVDDLQKRFLSLQQNKRKTVDLTEGACIGHDFSVSPQNNSIAAGEANLRSTYDGDVVEELSSASTADRPPFIYEESPQARGCPLLVCCSAGRAGGVRCGFDSFVDLRRLCNQYNVWLHVDAFRGAAFLLPPEIPLREYYEGISQADSLLWGFSPPLLGQTSLSATASTQQESTSPACAPAACPLFNKTRAPNPVIDSVYEDVFPIALLSRNHGAFFWSRSFWCSCSRVGIPVYHAETSTEPSPPTAMPGIPFGAGLKVDTRSGSRGALIATHLQKGGGSGLSDSSTTCIAASYLDAFHSPPSDGSAGYSLAHSRAADGSGFDASGSSTSSRSSMLQEWRRPGYHDSHATIQEEHIRSSGHMSYNNSNSNAAVENTQVQGPCVAGLSCAAKTTSLSSRNLGAVLAHWCGAGRNSVGLGFPIWCFWKKLGDVGVANRARQVYLQCRRLEVLARNFPFRLKPPEYPTFDAATRRNSGAPQNAAASTRCGWNSNRGNESSDDVAGCYSIDEKVVFDYEYARLHETAVSPLLADAALLLGLPRSVVPEQSATLHRACAAIGEQLFENGGDAAGKDSYAPPSGDGNSVRPFQLWQNPEKDCRKRSRRSPCAVSFRWLPRWCPSANAAVNAEKQSAERGSDIGGGGELVDRLTVRIKTVLDRLKKLEADLSAGKCHQCMRAEDRASYSSSTTHSTASRWTHASGHAEQATVHKQGGIVTGEDDGSHAALTTEIGERSEAEDFTESPLSSEDEVDANSATDVPLFTLLTENFSVGISGGRRCYTDVPEQGLSVADRKDLLTDAGGPVFLTVSVLDPRMTEDESYSLLCFIDRLGELLWSSTGVRTGDREASPP